MNNWPGIGAAAMRPVKYAGRLIGTGIAFACVFFGGGILAALLLPYLALTRRHRQERARLAVHYAFRTYVAALRLLNLIKLKTEGLGKLRTGSGRIVVANHPSLLDVVLLMSFIPNAQCIVKHQLWNHRFLGLLMRTTGFIRNDLEPEAMIATCQDSIDRGNLLIVFPEGTRTVPGQKPRFQRGFANLALMTGALVQPVTITCDPPTLVKGEKWWHLPPTTPVFTVVVNDCLAPGLYANKPHRSLASRKLVQVLEAFYEERL